MQSGGQRPLTGCWCAQCGRPLHRAFTQLDAAGNRAKAKLLKLGAFIPNILDEMETSSGDNDRCAELWREFLSALIVLATGMKTLKQGVLPPVLVETSDAQNPSWGHCRRRMRRAQEASLRARVAFEPDTKEFLKPLALK